MLLCILAFFNFQGFGTKSIRPWKEISLPLQIIEMILQIVSNDWEIWWGQPKQETRAGGSRTWKRYTTWCHQCQQCQPMLSTPVLISIFGGNIYSYIQIKCFLDRQYLFANNRRSEISHNYFDVSMILIDENVSEILRQVSMFPSYLVISSHIYTAVHIP